MHKFLLFLAGIVAFFVLLVNFGPMVILGLSVWLLYIIFKKFMQSDTTIAKIGWIILGLFVASITFSNLYAMLGIAALVVLYLVIKNWNKSDNPYMTEPKETDPFINFEREWEDLNKY